MKSIKNNTKLTVTLNQWITIRDKEMKISYDLRKHDVVAQAEKMMDIVKGMML